MKSTLKLVIASIMLAFIPIVSVSQINPAPVVGTTHNFVLYTAAGDITNAGTTSTYSGSVGTNAGTLTGFENLITQPTNLYAVTAETAQCATDLNALYTDLVARTGTVRAGAYGSETLTSGVYTTAGAASVGGILILDGAGDPNARFIIKTGGAFTMGAGAKIILTNGTQAKNVFWVITGACAIAANCEARGTFICYAGAISMGASCVMEGSALTIAGAITTLDGMTLGLPIVGNGMVLTANQTIGSGAIPADLILTGNISPVIKWQSSTDSLFTISTDIQNNSTVLAGFCIGSLITTTFYRAVILIDAVPAYSNSVKITITNAVPSMGPLFNFALFTTAGAITNGAGVSVNNALIGTNAGAITGTFSNMSLLQIGNALTISCANYLLPLFNDIKNTPTTSAHAAAFGAGELLVPGVYQIASAATLGGTLTLDGLGSTNSIFIIKITGALAMAASSQIILTNGALASNVFWVIDGALGVGASCAVKGTFICLAGAIALGNNCTTEGGIFTVAGAITLQNNNLSTPIGAIATSNQTICSGTQPQDLTLTGYVDSIVKWQKSSDLVFTSPSNITNTTTYLSSAEMGNLTATTYFRAVVIIGGNTVNSTTVTIAMNQAAIPGTISSNQEFCSASQPLDLILSGNCGSVIKWQSALTNDFLSPTDILNTTNTLTGAALGVVATTTFYRAIVQSCGCCPIGYSSVAKVTIATITTWNGTLWTNGPPSINKAVVCAANYTIIANMNACSMTINNGAVVTIGAGVTVTITNELNTSSGSITLENNASLVQVDNNAINIGNIKVNRTTSLYENFDFVYWSSPVVGATIGTPFATWRLNRAYKYVTSNFSDVFSGAYPQTTGLADSFDDNGDDWQNVAIGTVMTPGKGYIVMTPFTAASVTASVLFTGTPNNGIVNFPLVLSANNLSNTDDYNLVGNPYPSALDADSFINANIIAGGALANNISGTLYFWTHVANIQPLSTYPGPEANNFNSDDYATYTLVGGVGVSGLNSTIPLGKIASGQSFFVEAETNNNLVFNNSMRSGNYLNNQFYRTNNSATQTTVEKDRLRLNFKNVDNMFSQQLIGYFDNATIGFDYGYDGMVSQSQNYVSFYSLMPNNPEIYRIQAQSPWDNSKTVSLGYYSSVSGSSSISIGSFEGVFNLASTNVYLQDNLLNITHNLKQSPYVFTTAVGTFDSRFVLKYTNATLGTIDNIDYEKTVIVAKKEQQLIIKSAFLPIEYIVVYDLLGRKIFENNKVNNNEFTIENLMLNQQAIIVKVTLENGHVVNRKVVF